MKVNAKNIVVALFDQKLDYISTKPSNAERNKWRPATAILSAKGSPDVINGYILITESTRQHAATRLKPLLNAQISARISKHIPYQDAANKILSQLQDSIEIKPVDYTNIWDIKACKDSLTPILKEIIERYSQEGCTKLNLIISLLGNTAAAKTALYLCAKWLEQQHGGRVVTVRIVKSLNTITASAPPTLWVGTDISSAPNGLLRQGVNTAHPYYAPALDELERVIHTFRNARILITGPTGAGKTELANLIISYMQALHGDIKDSSISVQNVAAISPTLIESELFGHEAGAFTDAKEQHRGIFERSNNGIVFLDEIGELPKHLQAKLLTVLDGTAFTRVGGSEKIESRFLLICGTNKDLRKECNDGNFRTDLFERLNTWHIDVPPLRERPEEDLKRSLQREMGEWNSTKKPQVRFDHGAKDAFLGKAKHYPWNGNFRELHATFMHLALFAKNGLITKQAIEDEFNNKANSNKTESVSTQDDAQIPCIKSSISDSSYNLIDMASLACALDACHKCKTAKEAGEILFSARLDAARKKGTEFNGASSLQRMFAAFGLKAHFRHGAFSIGNLNT